MSHREDGQAIRKALRILSLFVSAGGPMRAKEIVETLGISFPTASRILGILEEEGFLSRDPHSKEYALGPRAYYLGLVAEQQFQFKKIALPFLERLRDETGETANLYLLDGLERVCIAQAESRYSLRRSAQIGERFPLWAGASGRCFLAFAKDLKLVVEALSSSYQMTPNTITDFRTMIELLEETRRKGFAASSGEREIGVSSIAAPVFDATGVVCASVALSGPSQRFGPEKALTFTERVIGTAAELSAKLGLKSRRWPPEEVLKDLPDLRQLLDRTERQD